MPVFILINISDVNNDNQNDVFYIPAGRIHATGAGIFLAEIQQTSDITYRIYDYDRLNDKGELRELHTDFALEALDFKVENQYKTICQKKLNS